MKVLLRQQVEELILWASLDKVLQGVNTSFLVIGGVDERVDVSLVGCALVHLQLCPDHLLFNYKRYAKFTR